MLEIMGKVHVQIDGTLLELKNGKMLMPQLNILSIKKEYQREILEFMRSQVEVWVLSF